MIINRRTLLAAASGLAVWPAFAEEAPPALAAYERTTGGRIGLYAENLATGAKIAWRAEERFVMCSTFKASLAAFALARVDRGEDRLDAMVSYGAQDLLDYAPVANKISITARCRWLTCARRPSSSATTPAPICCWREAAVHRP